MSLTITAEEAREIVRVLDIAREWPAVGDIFSGGSQDPAILRGNIAASKSVLDTALAALPPALLARLRGAAGTVIESQQAARRACQDCGGTGARPERGSCPHCYGTGNAPPAGAAEAGG